MKKAKIYEALLVLSTAFVALYLYGILKHGESNEVYIYLACCIGITGIFVKPIGKLIAMAWYKLADLLGFVMSKLLMALVYLVVLVPMALLYQLTKKDKLQLRRNSKSKWINRDHSYSADDLKNIW